jgi:hypothetical protein
MVKEAKEANRAVRDHRPDLAFGFIERAMALWGEAGRLRSISAEYCDGDSGWRIRFTDKHGY